MPAPVIGPDTIAAYERDGVVCLRAAFSPSLIELTGRGIDRNRAHPGRFARDQTPDSSLGRYLFEYWSWPDIDEFAELIHTSPAAEIAGRLMRAERATLVMDNWFVVEAGASNGAPWHHDKTYFDFDGRLCNVWFPLDDTPADEGLTFVAGSHRGGRLFKPRDFRDHVPFEGDMAAYADVPPLDGQRLLSWDLAVGDCLVFDLGTVHGASTPGRPSPRTSRRMSLRFAAEDGVFRPRGTWTAETTEHLLSLGLEVGGPLTCSLLPTVWEAEA